MAFRINESQLNLYGFIYDYLNVLFMMIRKESSPFPEEQDIY